MNRTLKKYVFCSLAAAALMTGLSSSWAFAAEAPDTWIIDENRYLLPYEGPEAPFQNGIRPGYGSGLAYKGTNADGSIDFYCITDRGPNGDIPTYIKNGKKLPGKFFPVPGFTPSIGILRVKGANAALIHSIPIRSQGGRKISGRVVPRGMTGSTGEVALDFAMRDLGPDAEGLDTEGIAIGQDGTLWICDEYGPFLINVDTQGKILAKYAPGAGLPDILSQRVPNRGFEGVTVDEKGYVYGLVQSPLNVDGKTKKTAAYARIVRLDPKTKAVTMFAYPLDRGYKHFGAAKLGDITSIGNDEFLVIEQGKQHGQMQNLVYKISLRDATPIDEDGSLEKGILPKDFKAVTKEFVLDLRKEGWPVEKAEGLALLPDRRTIAVVNDNDFGMDVSVNDPAHPSASLDDYEYHADTGYALYKKDGKVSSVRFGLTENAPEERLNYIYFFHLDQPL